MTDYDSRYLDGAEPEDESYLDIDQVRPDPRDAENAEHDERPTICGTPDLPRDAAELYRQAELYDQQRAEQREREACWRGQDYAQVPGNQPHSCRLCDGSTVQS